MNYVQAFKKTRTILMDELCCVTSALQDEANDREYWLQRLGDVNHALQALSQMQASRVLILDENQYKVMRTLLAFHDGNDDFGNNPNNWAYDEATLRTLIARLDNLEAQK